MPLSFALEAFTSRRGRIRRQAKLAMQMKCIDRYLVQLKAYLTFLVITLLRKLNDCISKLKLTLYFKVQVEILTSARYSSSWAATSTSQFLVRSRIGWSKWLYLLPTSLESLSAAWEGMINGTNSAKTQPKHDYQRRRNFPPFYRIQSMRQLQGRWPSALVLCPPVGTSAFTCI